MSRTTKSWGPEHDLLTWHREFPGYRIFRRADEPVRATSDSIWHRDHRYEETDFFIAKVPHARPEYRYGVYLSGAGPNGCALTLNRVPTLAQGVDVVRRQIERQREVMTCDQESAASGTPTSRGPS